MKKIIFSLLLSTATIAFSYAQEENWIDITEDYIQNPRFDGNSNTGWTYTSDASSQQLTYEAMEFWNGTFDIHQTITVPNGKYLISVQAYFRNKDNDTGYKEYSNGTENITGYLYANNDRIQIASIYSESLDNNYANGCWNPGRWGQTRYYPNNMQSGTYMFGQGMYENELVTTVTDGTLKFGLVNEAWVANNWCLFDNFKLKYWGTVVNISKINLFTETLQLVAGETQELSYTLEPENPTYKRLKWTSSDENVATVDQQGLITGVNTGTAVITAQATDAGKAMATCTVTVEKRMADASSLIINELQQSNVDMFVDPSFNYGSWVELYNPTDKAVSIIGFHVSEDPANLKMFRLTPSVGVIPAKGYKVLWFDHNEADPRQIDFKLDCDGGTFYIADENSNLVTLQSYPAAISRTSYARTTDGANNWGLTALPTPGKSNDGSVFATARLDAPIINKDSQLFTSSFIARVTIPDGATLKYTTDGTTPSATNGQVSTTGRFTVNTTTTYRFRLFQDGMLPSEVITRSYIYKDKEFKLPVISVVTDPVNLYDDSLGVYVKGVNGRPGNGQSTPCNWNMEWDRPVNFEYITPDGKMAFNQEVDFAMCGGWSRAWLPHSFKLKAAKVYEGRNSLNYQFFAGKPYLKHKTLQIRNGGNDNNCRIQDAALQTIISTSGIDIDGQSYLPTMHFINGEYKGVINMREPNNKHFAYANYGLDDEQLDQFEMSPDSGYCQKCGTDESFLRWYELSKKASEVMAYEEIRQMVDIDEFINYMAAEFYLGATDWPQNNVKAFKSTLEGGKFRFVLFDLDGTLSTTDPFNLFASKQNYTFDYLYDKKTQITEEIKLVTIFLNMLKNESFRKRFIDTYCLMGGSVFEPSRCIHIIDSLITNVADMMAYEGLSPYSTANQLKNGLANRQATMLNALKNYGAFGLSGTTAVQARLSANIPQAQLAVNSISIPTNRFNGSLFGSATLKAQAPANYKFIGWKSLSNVNGTNIFEKGSVWDYYDQGSLDGQNWNQNNYGTTWNNGKSPLGYYTSDNQNLRGYQTFLDYGMDTQKKRPTYYFRKKFTLDDTPVTEDCFVLNYSADDGFIVYVNGKEAARYLMPTGKVDYDTYSSTYANGNPDEGSLTLDASLFRRGTNLIAVEVHNNSSNSSDIYWDASLILTSSNNNGQIVCTEETYTLPDNGTVNLVACYEALSNDECTEAGIVPVRINEISADNSIYINDYFKKNDWIELYNTTDEAIDVAGMYVSDNLLVPAKYQISPEGTDASTIIAPHGYMVIWCDKLSPINQLHATFKLAKEGGDVLLTSADQNWHDKLSYPEHTGDMSVGRYPDGANPVYSMFKTSLGATNIMNSYAQFFDDGTIPDNIQTTQKYIGNLQLAYSDNRIVITANNTETAMLTISSIAAQVYMQQRIDLTEGQEYIDINLLPRGIYIVNVTTGNEQKLTMKIVKR